MSVIEMAGLVILAAAATQAGAGGMGAIWRGFVGVRHDRRDARLFEKRAMALLEAAEAERDRETLRWNGLRKFTIAHKVVEAEGICSFYLKPHDQKPLPPFEPGQYLTFQLRIPGQTKNVVRCYSLSDSARRRDYYRVTIKKLPPPADQPEAPPGVSSTYFHEQLAEGDTLDVRAPSGHFYLDQTRETPVVLIAGGVGHTPMVSMLQTICDSGSEREVWFFYGVRHGGEHAMKERLAELDRAYPNAHIVTFYSDPRSEDREGSDYAHHGHVSVDAMKEYLGSTNYEFYLCGPPPMMRVITEGLEEWGVPDSSVNYEAFGPATVTKTPQSREAHATTTSGVTVEFARSGKTCTWIKEVGTILDLAEAQGIALDFGCRAGNCGTCLTAIKEGQVEYLGEPGVPPEEGSCLSCIAVPNGKLVLDA
ncbi:2Fe-2S iron-sulfur cluster-binding protein [Halofilum ochraceum]|uniref:2Fe-2S iron-sulfur cluster-binding protein n=1 Tax=Halofilum ochraceum TaxID=1611323 RepID=UPI0008D9A2AC|nr:2Fe-2S iron-sulfur cluster-binding protein [Halofilum ochraceum]